MVDQPKKNLNILLTIKNNGRNNKHALRYRYDA